MEIPLQITGRNFELTEAIESEIRQKAEKLDKFYDRIIRCRVVVESPQRHQTSIIEKRGGCSKMHSIWIRTMAGRTRSWE